MKYILVWISFLVETLCSAQDYPRRDFNPASLVDEIFAAQDLDLSYQDLYENYLQLLSNPFDLNSVSEEQLRSLYLLNQTEIDSIVNYRRETGPFISVYELQTIVDDNTFRRLIPFVVVRDEAQSFNKNIFKRIIAEPNNYLILRWGRTLEQQAGYTNEASPSTHYRGSPDNFYTRFRTSRAGDFSVGFTLKKDAGEKIMWEPSKKYYGFDYISFHLQAQNKGRFKNIIVGDYQAQFGQGIALGSAFGIGKNSEAVTTMRRANLGFLPYTSTYEAGYFRGFAASYAVSKRVIVHVMASSRGRDGSLRQDTVASTDDFLSSFSYTGLHRTDAEIANRNAVRELNVASVIQFKSTSLDAGLIFHRTQFSVPLIRTPSTYNQFEFNGSANTNLGAYCNYSLGSHTFFSEFTQSVSQGNALVAGMLSSVTRRLDLSVVFRRFEKNFYSFYSNAIAENSMPQNETGIYWGWKYSFNKKISLAGYLDLFSFPWLKYRAYAPSVGSEWLFRLNYQPSKTVSIFLQAREESKARNTREETNLYTLATYIKRSYWINCDYAATRQLSFRTRLQASTFSFDNKTTRGMVLLQDMSWSLGRFSVSGRYALFDTDDYDNRLYVYEQDAWLSFTFPAYYGKGLRQYLLVGWHATRNVDLWLRWGHTRYLNSELIGSGGDAIHGDTRNDVKLQARIRL